MFILSYIQPADMDYIMANKVELRVKSPVWRILGKNMYERFTTTIGNTIYLNPKILEIKDPITEANFSSVISHELEHIKIRKSFKYPILNYDIAYLIHKHFRWKVEKQCYRVQIKELLRMGFTISIIDFAKMISDSYFMCSYQEAYAFLQEVINE